MLKINPDGSFDPAFTAPELSREAFPNIALSQTDGKVIVGGRFNRVGTSPTPQGGLVRLLANGTIDPSFTAAAPTGLDTLVDAGLASNGQVYALVSATTKDSSQFDVFTASLVRYNTNGSTDGSFVPAVGDVSTARLRVQGNQAYVFRNTVADVQAGRPLAARLNTNGSVDNTFSAPAGALGAVDAPNFQASLAPFTPLADLPGGGFLMMTAAGPFTATQTTFNVTLQKLKLDGTFDGTFTAPVVVTAFTGSGDNVSGFSTNIVGTTPFTAATVLANGSVLVAGTASAYGAVNAPAGVASLDATGAPNAAFSTALGTGPQNLRIANTPARVDKFLVQASGKIIVTGSFDTWNGKPAPGVARLNSDGSFDQTFFAAVNYYSYLPAPTELVPAGGNTFWLLGQYRRGVSGWPQAVNLVEFPPSPTAGAGPSNVTVVFGGTATFSVTPSGPGPFTFQWLKGSTSIGGATNSTLTITNAQFSDQGTYSVLITNPNGTTPSNTATLTVIDGFQAYRTANFNSGELADGTKSGPNAVFGFDGFTNLVKYALGLPAKPDAIAGLPTLTNDGTNWIYTYTRPSATTDLAYAVEVSTDMVIFTTTGVTLTRVSVLNGVETWRATFPAAGAPNLFMRLRVVSLVPAS